MKIFKSSPCLPHHSDELCGFGFYSRVVPLDLDESSCMVIFSWKKSSHSMQQLPSCKSTNKWSVKPAHTIGITFCLWWLTVHKLMDRTQGRGESVLPQDIAGRKITDFTGIWTLVRQPMCWPIGHPFLIIEGTNACTHSVPYSNIASLLNSY